MQYMLIAVLALAAWFALSPMLFPETFKRTVKKPSASKVTKKGVVLYTEEDEKAHFEPVAVPLKNAFKPLVAKVVTARAATIQVNNVPPEFAGGEANWTYTGSAEVDGVLQALLENKSTGEDVFLRVGDTWKGISVEEITDDSLILASVETGNEKVLKLPTEEVGPAAGPAGFAPANVGPLRGNIGPFTIQPDGSVAPDNSMNGASGNGGNGFGGNGGRRNGRRNGGGGGRRGGGFGGG